MSKSAAPLFLAFWSSYDDDAYGEDVPLGCVVRMDADLFARFRDAAQEMEAGGEKCISGMTFNLDADSVRWIKKVGYTSENSVSPIPGFMTEDDRLHAESAFLEVELGVEADFQDACEVYERPMANVRLTLETHEGEIFLSPSGRADLGHRRSYRFPSMLMPWKDVQAQADVFVDSERVPVETGDEGGCGDDWMNLLSSVDAAWAKKCLSIDPKWKEFAVLSHVDFHGDEQDPVRLFDDLVKSPEDAVEQVFKSHDAGANDRYGDSDLGSVSHYIQNMATSLQGLESLRPEGPKNTLESTSLVDEPRAYYESVVQIRVLSEDSPAQGMDLQALVNAIDRGDCVGQPSFLGAQQISAQTAARRLTEMGSEPGFFRLDESGVHEDDVDEGSPSVQRPSA